LVRTDFFQPAYLDIQVRLKTKLTPATRWAPILQWVLVVAAGAVILAGIGHNWWFARPIRLRSRPQGEPEDAGTSPDEPRGGLDTARDTTSNEGEHNPPDEGGRGPLRYLGRHRGDT
jgi:apolipoprotein N-acyltransferase